MFRRRSLAALRATIGPIGCLVAIAAAAATEADAPSRVEVTGSALADDGRDATAARVIVTRDEITRYGDNSVNDVLRRVPGITVVGSQGRAIDIRLRGLGSGYTQLLIDGEAVPAGFSLDALSPAQIERIEILRVPTVDIGAQAIAGTINIVLRQTARKRVGEVKAGVSSNAGSPSVLFDTQLSDRQEGFSYSPGIGLARREDEWPSTITQRWTDPTNRVDQDRTTERRAFGLARSASLSPKLGWQSGERDRVSLEAVLRRNRYDDRSWNERTVLLGLPPQYLSDDLTKTLTTTLGQTRLNWTHAFDNDAMLDLRLGTNLLRRDSDAVLEQRKEAQVLALIETVHADATERGGIAAGKLRMPYAQGHAIAIGWDGERAVRDEARTQRQSSPIGLSTVDLDESFRSTVDRFAVYAQDEWDIDDRLSLYAGLRWAALRTRTEGADFDAVGNRSAVTSPVLQLLWRPAGAAGDRVRIAASRTYKAPRAVDLMPRTFVAVDNTPTTPDLRGNPDLRPELAWGLDLAFEHPLAGNAGLLGLNASARRIENVIVDQLSSSNDVYVSTKANFGSARVYGIELDSRWSWRATWPSAPDAELRASVSRNWSTVDAVPGPDNRLAGQVPLSANIGADWRLSALPWTVGASLAWRGHGRAQTSATQTAESNTVRTLDLYALWRVTPAVQARLAVANALRPREIGIDTYTYADGSGTLRQTTDAPSEPTWRLALEWKL